MACSSSWASVIRARSSGQPEDLAQLAQVEGGFDKILAAGPNRINRLGGVRG